MDFEQALLHCGKFPGFSLCKSEFSNLWEASYWPKNQLGSTVLGSDESPTRAVFEFVARSREGIVPVAM